MKRTGESGAIRLSDSLEEAILSEGLVQQMHAEIRKASLLVNPSEDVFEGIEIIGYDSLKMSSFLAEFSSKSLRMQGDMVFMYLGPY